MENRGRVRVKSEDLPPELAFDKFELDLDMYGDDPALLTSFDQENDRKIKELQKVPKNDIRRHIPKMFLNAINCGDFPTCLGYLNTLMNPTATWAYEHVLKTRRRTRVRKMQSDHPRLSAYYIMALNVMFPDMMMNFTSCQLITSNMWEGSQLLIEGEFRCTQIYDISLQHAGLLISRLYHKRAVQIWECMEELSLAAFNAEGSDDGSSVDTEGGCSCTEPVTPAMPGSPSQTPSQTRSVRPSTNPSMSASPSASPGAGAGTSTITVPIPPLSPVLNDPLLPASAVLPDPATQVDDDQRKGRRKFQKVSTITTTSADEREMMLQVQEMFQKSPLCARPRPVLTKCSFVFRLDARHMVEEIHLVATEDLTLPEAVAAKADPDTTVGGDGGATAGTAVVGASSSGAAADPSAEQPSASSTATGSATEAALVSDASPVSPVIPAVAHAEVSAAAVAEAAIETVLSWASAAAP